MDRLISEQEIINILMDNDLDHIQIKDGTELIQLVQAIPSAEPKTGYISIDDVMSVFDDYMCGEVDEEGTDTFLEMLRDKAEQYPQEPQESEDKE